jgi:phosphopantothenoylcysteine decarboxylase/phosphopantothenate--cysteine ligase
MQGNHEVLTPASRNAASTIATRHFEIMQGKTIVLGVCGGIAAYKACDLASRLTQNGALVHVVMTQSATRFVAPLTFEALTGTPVHTSLWPHYETRAASGENSETPSNATSMAHIALADKADCVLVAPASANTLGRLAHGLADDLLSTLILATSAPVVLAPAMNPKMLAHPATQRNLETLRELNYTIIEPESGRMACEHVGTGRLPQTDVMVQALKTLLNSQVPAHEYSCGDSSADLRGKTVLVTAGPTRESLDPVRFLSNRSSGKMGYALAQEAVRRGARAVLVSGPTQLDAPSGVERIDVVSTQQMFDAATQHAPQCDLIIAAAAPADYRPRHVAPQKIKKSTAAPNTQAPNIGSPNIGSQTPSDAAISSDVRAHEYSCEGESLLNSSDEASLHLELVPTPDIVAHIARVKKAHQIVIGFAAETSSDLEEARRKLRDKNLDAIVFNDVSQAGAGFDVDTNRVTWIARAELQTIEEAWPLLPKNEVAARILDRATAMLKEKP